MRKSKALLIGSFPPPYGGATIKNEIMFNSLSKHCHVDKINTNKVNAMVIAKILLGFIPSKYDYILLSISSYSLIKMTKIFNLISRKKMKKVSVFIVGGRFPEFFEEFALDKNNYNNYKNIYVECYGMKAKLEGLGLENVDVIPNFRAKYIFKDESHNNKKKEDFKIIFLSRICEDKGIWIILEACRLLNSKGINYSMDFYGPIDSQIFERFNKEIKEVDNVNYKGIFDAINNDVYAKLKEYHVLALPTFHKGEGVPGILVESKIAGITSIVSNINYNCETIKHMDNGIVLNENNPIELAEWLIRISEDEKLRNELAKNAYKDSKRYLIENYIEKILG